MNTPSQNAEYAVIGDYLKGDATIEYCRNGAELAGLEAKHFENPVLAKAFSVAMDFRGVNRDMLLKEICAAGVPVEACMEAVSHASESATEVDANIEAVLHAAYDKQISARIAEERKVSPNPQTFATNILFSMKKLLSDWRGKGGGAKKKVVTMEEFAAGYDEKSDEADRLFAGDQDYWLARGGACVLLSTTGAGKSILSMQMALNWAAGKPCCGIVPVRPLKVVVFQTEDSAKIVKRNLDSYRLLCGLGDEEYRRAVKGVSLADAEGLMGEDFIKHFARIQSEGAYDLAIINPLQGVMAGLDIKSNQELTKFLRSGLDSVIKGERPGCPKCALMLVHHTNKPVLQGSGGYGIGSLQYMEYMCAGGAELANWMRSLLVMMPESGKMKRDGHINLVAGKTGAWLGWPATVESRPAWCLRRHDPAIDGGGKLVYWHDAEPLSTQKPTPVAEPKGPTEEDVKALADAIKAMARPPTLTQARKKAEELFGRGAGWELFEMLKKDLSAYGLKLGTGDSPAQKLIVGV